MFKNTQNKLTKQLRNHIIIIKGGIIMLIQFSVVNFMSFKNKAVLSFSAGNESLLPENEFKVENERLLKSIALDGANAAGKSK